MTRSRLALTLWWKPAAWEQCVFYGSDYDYGLYATAEGLRSNTPNTETRDALVAESCESWTPIEP